MRRGVSPAGKRQQPPIATPPTLLLPRWLRMLLEPAGTFQASHLVLGGGRACPPVCACAAVRCGAVRSVRARARACVPIPGREGPGPRPRFSARECLRDTGFSFPAPPPHPRPLTQILERSAAWICAPPHHTPPPPTPQGELPGWAALSALAFKLSFSSVAAQGRLPGTPSPGKVGARSRQWLEGSPIRPIPRGLPDLGAGSWIKGGCEGHLLSRGRDNLRVT